jgi:hypothetical protein
MVSVIPTQRNSLTRFGQFAPGSPVAGNSRFIALSPNSARLHPTRLFSSGLAPNLAYTLGRLLGLGLHRALTYFTHCTSELRIVNVISNEIERTCDGDEVSRFSGRIYADLSFRSASDMYFTFTLPVCWKVMAPTK